ncbi:MAG: hypothetical protein M0R40_10775 [Firmicutes bacterium]|nr:hypothetical protein [Bacillota bacterium]
MLKDLAWGFFERTGNIETFLEYNQLTDAAENSGIAGCKTDLSGQGDGINDCYCKGLDN